MTSFFSLFEQKIEEIKMQKHRPKLLLHACCAPCSSSVLETLDNIFDISLFFYNPNISSKEEYEKRLNELFRLVSEMPHKSEISVIDGIFSPDEFFSRIKGLENEKERGKRCFECYALRLSKTADFAEKNGFDYFCTTLSLSPLKDANKINEIGFSLAENKNTMWLPSDFKKKNGYLRSIELSKQYSLYRQDYCGCIFSKEQREKQKALQILNGSESK